MKQFLLLLVCWSLFHTLNFYVSLNTPTVLLPWYSNSTGTVTYELKAKPETSCLRWRPQTKDVVAILKKNPEGTSYLGDTSRCSNSILLAPISSKPLRRSTIIMAENGVDTYLRCDVIIDKIKRIEIVTRTRELNVGEMFENIEIVGYDDQNNVFNTLIGLSFQWTIKATPNSAIKDINSIMKITNFDQTSYTADPKINELETKGLHGSSIMIEPINTGEVILTATFKDPSYENTISSSVVILVRGDIFLGDDIHDDPNIYALVHTAIDIKPRRFFRGKFDPITLPSTQYVVNISNSDIVELEYGKIRTKKLGNSNVAVIDNYIPRGKHSSIPSVLIHVINPNIIDVRVQSCNTGESCWYFASKSVIDLDVNLFFETHKLNIDSGVSLLTEIHIINQKVAKINQKHTNGSQFSIDALKKGKTELKLILKGYINDKRITTTLEKPLEFFKSFYVVDPISITSLEKGAEEVVLTEIYLAELPKAYNQPITLNLKAHGGTEQFQWKLREPNYPGDIISIVNNQPGKIIVNPKVGIYHVLVTDAVASYASGITSLLTIIIEPIDHFKFSHAQYEVYTNETLSTTIDLYVKHPTTKLYHRVYDFAPLPFVFKTNMMQHTLFLYDNILNTKNVKVSTPKLSTGAQLVLNDYGDYQMHATLGLADRPHLKSSTSVRAYNHLSLVSNKHCHMLNALPGSDIVMTIMGGPFAKQGMENSFFTTLELLNSTNIFAQRFPILSKSHVKSDDDTFTWALSCQSVGSVKIKITLGNKWINALTESIIISDVECAHPNDFVLNNLPIVGYENITFNRRCGNTHLRFDVDFVVELQLIHRVKNVPICTFPKSDIIAHARFRPSNKYTTPIESEIPKLSIKNVGRNNEESSFGYYSVTNENKFVGTSNLHIELVYSHNTYKNFYNKEIVTTFVSLPAFAMDSVHLIQHKDDVAIVPIIGGSGVFKSVTPLPSIVSITIEPYSKYIKQLSKQELNKNQDINKHDMHEPSNSTTTNSLLEPLQVAIIKSLSEIGRTLISMEDECLPGDLNKSDKSLEVSVDVLQHIHVNCDSKVMIGGSSLIEISLFDSSMRSISKDKFHLIDFTYKVSTEAFINIEKASSLWPDNAYNRYWLVRPLAVGTTTLNIIAHLKQKVKEQAISTTITIETYDPLRVSPNIIHAIPHMTFQLNLRGGPAVSSDHRIEYHFDNDNVHKIIDFSDQKHSIYTKNEGEVILTLKSVSISTEQMLSQATVKIYCHKLESVHIHSSSSVILQNSTVIVKAKFRNAAGQFTTFGILPHGVAIYWDVPPPNEIVSSYWLSGFDSEDDGSECINLQLNDLGRFSLQLKVFIRSDYLKYVGGSKLELHNQLQHPIHYLFAKHDFETVPRLSIEPSKSLQTGWFNWKNHDQHMLSSLSLMADYSSLEYMIPADGAVYIINSNYNNLLTGESPSATNIDSVVHWTIVSSNPSNLIQISCQDSENVIDTASQSIQCSNRNLHVKSSHLLGDAIIMANRRFQSRPIMIKVKSVNQISLIFVSELKVAKVVVENKRWFAFPVGYTAKFKLVAMDEHGGIFSVVQAKSYTSECVNCRNILLKNSLEQDGSVSVTMKYPGSVAIKISHVDKPNINFVLRFIIIHGLDPSHSPPAFINKHKYENVDYLKNDLYNDNLNNDLYNDNLNFNEEESTTTIVNEITIQRPVGMVFLLSPIFTMDNHQQEWLVSDEKNLKLLWKNLTQAVLYSVKLGECKLTVVSSTSKQPHGYAVVSNIPPDGIMFDINRDTKSGTYISNYKHFEKCIPIKVLSNAVNSSILTTIDTQSLSHTKIIDTNIEHPFVCDLIFPNESDRVGDIIIENYLRRHLITQLKIDLSKLMVTCCVQFVYSDNDNDDDFGDSTNNIFVDSTNSTFSQIILEAHLKDNPNIDTKLPLTFVPKFRLLIKTVFSSSGEITHLSESSYFDSSSSDGDGGVGENLIGTPIILVLKDGSVATIQLQGDLSYFPYLTSKSSHPSCFKVQMVPDYYSNKTLLIRVNYNFCQTFKKDVYYWVEVRNNLTGQIVKIRIILSDKSLMESHSIGSTWFYLQAAFNALPRVISIDINTIFFTLLSVIGSIVVVFFLIGGEGRLTTIANDIRKVAHNATSMFLPQSFYKKEPIQRSPSSRGSVKYNHLLQSSKSSRPSSISSKNSLRSDGLQYDRKPTIISNTNGGAIYDDDDFGKPHKVFKPYNVSN